MARTHHRKKHKEHLRQFKQDHENASLPSFSNKGKSTTLFTVIGAITGIAISYFAAGSAILWLALGLIAGGIAGYYIGYKIDTDK
jgi:hypothetical protein